jgi:hypothetical protein
MLGSKDLGLTATSHAAAAPAWLPAVLLLLLVVVHLVWDGNQYIVLCAQCSAHGSDALHYASQASSSAAQSNIVARHKRPRQELEAAASTAVNLKSAAWRQDI